MYLTADISNISRCSLHDGPGLRTVVYFKGCGLRCRWCHNPETFTRYRDILYIPSKCIHCGRCVKICPKHHIIPAADLQNSSPETISGNDMIFLRDGCTKCGKCASACPAGALVACGEQMSVEEVMAELRKDDHYYTASSGGITLSGGECLLQSDFAAALLRQCKNEGIHTLIETALFVFWANIEKVLLYTDMFFTDLKIPDPEKHKFYTGQDNRLILENLNRLGDAHANITLRIPLIPGVNDSPEDMEAFGSTIKSLNIQNVELLRYNYMAESKYQNIGLAYESFGSEAQSNHKMTQLQETLQIYLPEKKVFYK